VARVVCNQEFRVGNLLLILGILFVSLFAFIYLTERVAKPMDPEKVAKLSRWIIPLVALSILIQLFRSYFS
jgi:cadmium resistance protein CadD (predicted permease)